MKSNIFVMAAMSLMTIASLSSCDKITSESDNPTPAIEVPEEKATLDAALEDGALITVTVNIDGVPTKITFKKVGDNYVYQAPSGTRGIANAVYTLTYVEGENQLVFSVKKATGELVYGVAINMDDQSYTPLESSDPAADDYAFTGGLSVNNTDLSSDLTLNDIEKLMFTAQDLSGNALEDISSLTITKGDGVKASSASVCAGWMTVNKADLASGDYWFEAKTSNGKKYIAKMNIGASQPSSTELEMATWGNVIGNDGKFYANKAAIDEAGLTAAAIIAYIGNDADTSDKNKQYHGLAMALEDVTCEWNPYVSPRADFPDDITEDPMTGIMNTTEMAGTDNTTEDDNPGKKVRAYSVNSFTPADYGFSDWFIPCLGQFYKTVTSMCAATWHGDNTDIMKGLATKDYDGSALSAAGYNIVLNTYLSNRGFVGPAHGQANEKGSMIDWGTFPIDENLQSAVNMTGVKARPFIAF